MVSATEAYLRVSAGCTREAAYANASRALSLDKVQEEIARIQEEAAKRSTIAAALRQKYLEDILRAAPAEIDENSPLAQRVKRKTTLLQDGELAEVEITIVSKMEAMKELNRMTGAYAPEKHEVAWPKLTEAITQPAGQLPADD